MASNIQRGTRGLSAGDITRLKRLSGARTFETDTTTNPDPRLEAKTARRVYTEFGTSKIRRPASNFTDYVASQTVDYVLEKSSGSCGAGKALTINKLCTCDTSSAIKHNGLCRSCTYDRIVVRRIGSAGGGGGDPPPATAPTAPRSFTATTITSESLTFTWIAPLNDGGTPITGYTVTLGTEAPRVINDPTATSAIFTGLTPSTSYTTTIVARNSVGNSVAATTTPSTTAAPATAPSAPRSFTASTITPTSLTFTWIAPESDGGTPITRYSIELVEQAAQDIDNGSATSTIFTNLTADTEYTARIVAKNIIGTSFAASTIVRTSASLATAPTVPRSFTASTITPTSLTFTWIAPLNDGGTPITGYTVTLGTEAPRVINDPTATSTTFTGLVSSTSYTTTIVARNSVGNSLAATITPSTTAAPVYTWRQFTYTGTASPPVEIPSGATAVTAYVVGAGGGHGDGISTGGTGGMIRATFSIDSPITVYVGGGVVAGVGGGGGGSSAVTIGNSSYIIAGGGGGGGGGIGGGDGGGFDLGGALAGRGGLGADIGGANGGWGGGGGGGFITSGGNGIANGTEPDDTPPLGGGKIPGGIGGSGDSFGEGANGGWGGGGGGTSTGYGGGGGGYSGGDGGGVGGGIDGGGGGGTCYAFGMSANGGGLTSSVFDSTTFNGYIAGSGFNPVNIGLGGNNSVSNVLNPSYPGYVVLRFE